MNNTNKPLILFDIDLTLFDTDYSRQNVYLQLAQVLNISFREFSETLNKYTTSLEKSSDFLPQRFLRHIAGSHNFPFQILCNVYYNPQNFIDSLYPDTLPALSALQSQCALGIFSEGHMDFQITKLKYSGIYDYFDPDFIYIHRRKINPEILINLPQNTVIVDDRIEVIEKLHHFPDIFPVWLNRKDSTTRPGIPTIHTLTELS